MKVCGIIAEFNPFHNGHKYLIDAVRAKLGPCGIVCVMSGDFVQRGYAAFSDKWERAKQAVLNGADLVLELPTVYALSSAEGFAKGGLKVLNSLGVVDTLAFGSESGELPVSLSASGTDFDAKFKSEIAKGISYSAAFSNACGQDLGPNDILAFQYLAQNPGFEPLVIKRGGDMGHNESASIIRGKILAGEDVSDMVPGAPQYTWDADCEKRLFQAVKMAVLASDLQQISNLSDVSEGLENLIISSCEKASDFNELVMAVKSKRYTYSRISRIFMQLLLGISKDLYKEIDSQPAYARVLAFNTTGAEILKTAKKQGADIITNLSKKDLECSQSQVSLGLDIKASKMYAALTNKSVGENLDFVKKPFIAK